MKKNKKAPKKPPTEKKVRKEQNFIDEIMPVVAWDDAHDCAVLSDGTMMGIFGIVSRNLQAASVEEIEYINMLWTRTLSTYAENLKEVSFNFPTDTSKQIAYLDKVLERTKNPVYRDVLEFYKQECIYISEHNTDREFFLLFFAKSSEEYRSLYMQLHSQLASARQPLITEIPTERRQKIIKKLNNMAMKRI